MLYQLSYARSVRGNLSCPEVAVKAAVGTAGMATGASRPETGPSWMGLTRPAGLRRATLPMLPAPRYSTSITFLVRLSEPARSRQK